MEKRDQMQNPVNKNVNITMRNWKHVTLKDCVLLYEILTIYKKSTATILRYLFLH